MNTIKKKSMSKIDFHVHYLPKAYKEVLLKYCGERPDNSLTPDWDAESHLEVMDCLGISTSMLSLSSPHINFRDKELTKALAREFNEDGITLAKKYPGRFGLFASLPLPDVEDSIAEIQYAVNVLHVDGFALPTNTQGVYLGNECLDPIMEELNRYKSFVVIHPNKPSSVPAHVMEGLPIPWLEFFNDTTRTVTNMILKGTLERFPDIKFIIPHAGAFLSISADRISGVLQGKSSANYNKLIRPEDIDVYAALRSLYYDVAGVCLPRQLPCLMQLVGVEHLFYGSDYPYTKLPQCMMLADMLDKTELLTDRQRQSIYSENALSLFPKLLSDK